MSGKKIVQYIPDYVVFDLETTGISPVKDEVIEISAVKVREGKVVDTFSSLVNPGRSIPWAASSVNHITDEMVSDAPAMQVVLQEFMRFVGDDVLVGHNIHSFDMKFIQRDARRFLDKEIENDYIDTLHLARKCLPQLAHHRLVDISAFFEFSTEGAHRALNDCMMNQKCFEEMAKIQSTKRVVVCPKCGGELLKRNGKFGVFMGCSNFPTCRYTENC